MNRKILTLLLMAVTLPIFAIEYNTYEMEEVHVFSASDRRIGGDTDLSIITEGTNPGPDGPAIFFKGNQLVISDQANWGVRKTIFLNEDYSFDHIIDDSFVDMYVINYGEFFVGVNPSYLKVIDSSKGWEMEFSSSKDVYSFLQGYKDVYYQDNTLFIFDKEFKLWAIKDPSLDNDKNRANIINEDEIISEIKSGKYKGLTIDDKKRLLFNGAIQTINYEIYYSFYKEQHPNKDKLSNNFKVGDKIIEVSPKSSSYMTYLSSDKDGNMYWKLSNKYIVIFNKSGLLNNFFQFDTTKSSTYPAVSPTGDIYFFKYGTDKVTLYKIPRQW